MRGGWPGRPESEDVEQRVVFVGGRPGRSGPGTNLAARPAGPRGPRSPAGGTGADLATPLPVTPPEYPQLRIDESYVSALETACDAYNAGLPTLRTFILPGGTPGAGPRCRPAGWACRRA